MSEDWTQRQVCPDGSCIGVIGPDGTCKVCGRAAPNWGEERKRGLVEPEDADEDEAAAAADADADAAEDDDENDDENDHDVEDDADAEAEDEAESETEADPVADRAAAKAKGSEWTKRQLCPDGACIGVIGSNGVCKVCGKSAKP